MNAIFPNTLVSKDFTGYSTESSKFYFAQFNQVTTSQEESRNITILTAEGDKVTILADSQSTSQYSTYNGFARVNNMSLNLQGKSISTDSSSEFLMLVEGDLNKQEVKDIQKAMKAIDKIMQSTLSGNLKNAMAMVNKVGNLESIASFEANIESKKSVVVEQALMMVAEKTVESPSGGETEESIVNRDSLKQAADQIMDIMEHSGVKPSKFIKPLNRYLSNQLDKNSDDDHEHPKHIEMGRSMRSELLERIKQLQEAKEGSLELEPVNEDLPEIVEDPAPVEDGLTNMETESSMVEA
ncbi:MAG: hypothetical protein KKC46_20685 [Proteobacteria bacterium]|nr:hypothetical protein [Pseudomonadota bacterium]